MKKQLWPAVAAMSAILLPAAAFAEDMYDKNDYAGAKSYSIGKTVSAKLDGNGRAVFKITPKKGSDYTFVTDTPAEYGTTAMSLMFIYKDSGDNWDSQLSMSETDVRSDTTERLFVTKDDWIGAWLVADPDDDDPTVYSASAYYLVLEGDGGATVSLSSSQSIVKETIPQGVIEKPAQFGALAEGKSVTKKANITIDGNYCFTVALAAGQRCKFTVSGDFSNADIEVPEDSNLDPPRTTQIADVDAGTLVLSVVAEKAGTYLLIVDGESGGAFTVTGSIDQGRPVPAHPLAGTLEDGAAQNVEAGARNDSNDEFYDETIDTSLFAVNLKAGELALFETEFQSDTPCVMEIYDSAGTVLAANEFKAPGVYGQRIAVKPDKTGTYYVGVCQRDLDLMDNPGAETVSGSILYTNLGVCEPEADDTPAGGNTLKFALGDAATEGALQTKADGSATAFGAANTEDWFILGARKGIGYNLKAESGAYVPERPMNLSVYSVDSKGAAKLVKDLGDPQEGAEFLAPENATYYVRASLPGGKGVDYPYSLYAWVDGDGYGFLKVDIKGASGGMWNLKGEANGKYGPGAEILLKAGTSATVQASAVNGWTKPADQTVQIEAGGGGRKEITLKYSDTADPKDDTAAGAANIAPAYAKPVSAGRSLWQGDDADWFKFQVKTGTVYDFALDVSEGSPEMTIYRNCKISGGGFKGEQIDSGTESRIYGLENATYYIAVRKADGEDGDAAYTLNARSCAVGLIKPDKKAYTAGEKAGTLAVKLSRTSKEGRVRVRWTTREGSAKPEKDYVAASGTVEWEHGDGSVKTIEVRILPDLIDSFADAREFSIVLDSVSDFDFNAAEEYYPMLTAAELPVTITDSSKAAPGVLSIAACGESMEEFAKPASPAFTVAAGEEAVLWIARTGGSDMPVGASVTVTAAQKDGDTFVDAEPQEIWWEDGDTETKAVRIQTMRPTDGYFADRKFTVKIAALKSDGAGTPQTRPSSAAVTVTDGETSKTFAEYAASYGKASGTAVKASGLWHFDAAGTLRSDILPAKGKTEITFSATGPGHLAFTPRVESGGEEYSLSCQIGGSKIEAADGERIERWISGTGRTDVKLSLQSAVGGCRMELEQQEDGSPFLWEPLETPAAVQPAFGENQLQAPGAVHLEWSAQESERTVYLLYIDKDRKKIGTGEALVSSLSGNKPAAPYLRETKFCPGCEGLSFDGNAAYFWRVDSAMLDDSGEIALVNTNKTVWAFKTTANGAPVAEAGQGADSSGADFAELAESGETAKLVQGVAASIPFTAQGDGLKWGLVKGSKLPDGMKLDPATGEVSGAPLKTGLYSFAVYPYSGNVQGAAAALSVEVESPGVAAGKFNGLLETEDPAIAGDPDFANLSIGSFSLTAAESGSLSAKAVLGTASHVFTAKNWDETALQDGAQILGATLYAKPQTLLGAQYTNTLHIAARRGGTNDWDAIDAPLEVELTVSMLSADKKSVIENVTWTGTARRDNSALKHVTAQMADFAGYYTITLDAADAPDGAPQGNGYLTATLDAKGSVKVAGSLADGSTFSCSAAAAFVSENGEYGEKTVLAPVYSAKGKAAFGGWLRLRLEPAANATLDGQEIRGGADVPVAAAGSRFIWIDAGDAAWDGMEATGFLETLEPAGGWYSTVVNLMAYYRNHYMYLTDPEETGSLPYTLLEQTGGAWEFSAWPGRNFNPEDGRASGLYLDIGAKGPVAEKTSLAYAVDGSGRRTQLADWAGSANPCKFTIAFKAPTGEFSGSFDIYASLYGDSGEETAQKKLGSFKHKGVMVMARDPASSLLATDAAMSGFYLAPAKVKDEETGKTFTWNASYKLLFGLETREAVAEGLQ